MFRFRYTKSKFVELTKWIPFLGLAVYGGYCHLSKSYGWLTGGWLCYHLFITNLITIIIHFI